MKNLNTNIKKTTAKVAGKAKTLIVKYKDTLAAFVFSLALTIIFMPTTAYAGGDVAAPFKGLRSIFETIAYGLGLCLLGFGGIRFAMAFQKGDQPGESNALHTVAAGGICLAIGVVFTALGWK